MRSYPEMFEVPQLLPSELGTQHGNGSWHLVDLTGAVYTAEMKTTSVT